MDLRRLAMFVAVAEELNFTRAAERVAIAQPPLSQHIRRLEDELGVKLFTRTSRRVELTAGGHQLLKGARELLAKRAEIVSATRRAAGGEAGSVRLSVGSSSAFGIVAEIIRAFRSRFPAVSVVLDERESDQALPAIVGGELDVAIGRGPVSDTSLAIEILLRERLDLVIPDDHRLASRREVLLSDVAAEPMILFPRHSAPALHDAITSLCVRAGFSPIISQEGSSWASVVGLVGAGLGFTIAPASAASIKPANVVFKAIKRLRGEAELILAYRKENLPPAGEHLIQVAKEVASKSADDRYRSQVAQGSERRPFSSSKEAHP
jgi:DNA-binding transcriptional LysR family regulator